LAAADWRQRLLHRSLLHRHWESSLLDRQLFSLVLLKADYLGLLVKHDHIRLLLRGDTGWLILLGCLNLVFGGELSHRFVLALSSRCQIKNVSLISSMICMPW